ncbi:histidine kinase [Umezawaea sp. Da 62-37]|uniref:sensor histidine kinase n=1 Tax=Umezawaea sp. Da 62-37 TaxID=3075927 RepID=UPI0028F709DB|nr:histidine kinase [Umezawaea sp. Da 62-37]WNV89857.1 histidine kinase [Umezawaea sp. Da 62-37]
MTIVVRRFAPELTGLRDRPSAYLRDVLHRFRQVTPWRVGCEVFGLAWVFLLDLAPGWLADSHASGWSLVALGAAFVALYLMRLCFPAVALLLALLVAFGTDCGGITLMVVVAYAAGHRIESWRRALLTAVLGLALYMLLWEGGAPGLTGLFGSFVMLTVYGMVVALPFLVGRYIAQRNALVAALQEREERMRRERTMLTRQVRLRERNRIAQDMHDSLGHRLSLISVHAGALALDGDLGEKQREAVQVLRSAALTGMEELRGVIGVLRRDDPPEDDLARRTVEAIDELVDGARRAGVRVSLVRGGQPCPLPSKVSHAAYRVAQEGLTNANKHAPGASVQLTVKYEPDALVVEVRNNPSRSGAAGDPGVGLIGLGERVRVAGGLLHVGPLPTGGFRIAAVLPYEDTTVAEEPEDSDEVLVAGSARTGVRKWAGVGSIVAAGLVVFVVVGGYTWIGIQPVTNVVDRPFYDSVHVGQPEAEVRARLGSGAQPAQSVGDLRDRSAPEPAGAVCEYRLADEQTYTSGGQLVLRFCFAGGRVVEKNSHLQRI